ncbi:hypothetical protein JVU11DRAFT_4525 [Chiua virens]|nr:hypothetical protein JVU11DRAFT_4525 [Chiua virens]
MEATYNDEWNEADACQLVANSLGLNQYFCGWITDGQRCNVLVLGEDVTDHLRAAHNSGEYEGERLTCLWDGCEETFRKGSLVRHVQEKHLEYRWPCPKCGIIFTRRGVMDAHRVTCSS